MKLRSKSSLFLIELIVVILFFSIAGTVCIQLFVKSHLLSTKTKALNQCVKYAQNYAEVFTNMNGSRNDFLDFLDNPVLSEDKTAYHIYFDKEFQITGDFDKAFYDLKLVFDASDNNISVLNMNFYKISDNTLLYGIDVKKYTGTGGANNEK